MRNLLVKSALLLSIAAVGLPAQTPGPPAEREQLEQRFRQRAGEVVRARLGLNDEQMAKLRGANTRLERERRSVMMRERSFREGLRGELDLGEKASQSRVSALLDSLTVVHRDRAELIAGEQRELATFLTPVQRAKYFGLQTQIRRRMDEMRRGGRQRPGPFGR